LQVRGYALKSTVPSSAPSRQSPQPAEETLDANNPPPHSTQPDRSFDVNLYQPTPACRPRLVRFARMGRVLGIMLLSVALVGCGATESKTAGTPVAPHVVTTTSTAPQRLDNEALGAELRLTLQQKLDTEEIRKYGLRVVKVTVANEAGNQYRALAEVQQPPSPEVHLVSMQVVHDGESTLYELDFNDWAFVNELPVP